MALMARDPAPGTWVAVGPPWLASGPSSGLVAGWSPVCVRPHVASVARLYPTDVTGPEQARPADADTIVPPIARVAPPCTVTARCPAPATTVSKPSSAAPP